MCRDRYKNGCYREEVETVESLIDIFNDLRDTGNEYLFRGHANKNWKLLSSLDREYYRFGRDSETGFYRNDYVAAHLKNFREKLRGKVSTDEYFNDDVLAWTYGQHYGLKTPYLDWTYVPFFAAFFSLDYQNSNEDGCIYVFNKTKKSLLNKLAQNSDRLDSSLDYDCERELKLIDPLTNLNERLIAQRGCFTLTPEGIDLETWIDSIVSGEEKILLKLIICKKMKKELKQFLEDVNINSLTLFPDVYGIANICNEQCKDVKTFFDNY